MSKHDLIVIGGGPGGYIAAIRAAQLGLNAACIEQEPALGGTCLRIGCIPSKALLESSHHYWEASKSFRSHGIRTEGISMDVGTMLKRKESVVRGLTAGVASLFKKNNITRYEGHGRIVSPTEVVVQNDSSETRLEAKTILIATGSKSAPLKGVELDGDRIGTSTEALSYPEVPARLAVIGAGAIGLELGSVWKRLGAKVTVIEYLDRILPGMDLEIANEARKIYEKQGLEFHLGCRVMGARFEAGECVVELDGREPILADRVLLSVGRIPNTENLGLETVGVNVDGRGRIQVNERFETSVKGIYAIGDVIGGLMLAHKAEEEGVAFAENLVLGHGHIDYNSIPGIVYTHPEVASVGRTEEDLIASGIPYRKGSFPFLANGRARSMGESEGRVKLLAHAESDQILGVHILGPHAGDLIAEAAVAIAQGIQCLALAGSSHAHPTLAEALKEAALAAHNRALNM